MKTLLATVALATVIASSAFAAESSERLMKDQEAAAQSTQMARGRAAQAFVPDADSILAGQPVHNVYVDGRYVGADPDPLIREQLEKEAHDN